MEVLAIATIKDNPINEQIRCKEMMVIGPNGEQLGIKSKEDALTLAGYAGFDLVLMSENGKVPVCKIMDYNKFKYEKKKKTEIFGFLVLFYVFTTFYLIFLILSMKFKWKKEDYLSSLR